MDNTQLPQISTFIDTFSETLELANKKNWQEILEDAGSELSLENIGDRVLTQEEKDAVCNLLIQRMVKAVKAGELAEEEITAVSSFISSHVEQMTIEATLKDFLYLLAVRWPCFADMPSLLYETPKSGREEIEKLAMKGME